MTLLILNHDEVVQLLTMDACIAAMSKALIALTNGQVHQPMRSIVQPPDAKGPMLLMPSFVDDKMQPAIYGLKTICIFHGNAALGKEAHQGAVMLFSGETGEALAVMNASAITAIRTAAVSALATDLLARQNAGVLAIIGTGVQARSHLEAISCVRPLQEVRVAGRSLESAQKFVAEQQGAYPFPIRALGSVEQAVLGAGIIVTATTSSQPILKRDWISFGTHINAVGAYRPTTREIDSATVAASRLFVDYRASTQQEAGDFLIPEGEGIIGPDHIQAEIGEVLVGQRDGRAMDAEITLFKSLGLPVQDLAAAAYLYQTAQAQGAGTWVPF